MEDLNEIRNQVKQELKEEMRAARRTYKKAHYQANRECYLNANKKYYAANGDAIRAHVREWYKNKIKDIPIITCECSISVREDSMPKHLKSKRHLTYLEKIQKAH